MGLMDEFGAWLDQKKRNVVANAQNLPGLLSSFAREVQQGAAADKSAFDASRSVMPEVREQGIREMNARGQELGGLLGTFAGVGAKTADVAKLGKAKAMVKAGADPVDVWKQTGWTDQFPDGKWRFEIPDNESVALPIRNASLDDLNRGNTTVDALSDVFSHQQLGNAYPGTTQGFDANNSRLIARIRPGGGESASFSDGVITVGDVTSLEGGKRIQRSPALHEIQHYVQDTENFARGGSPQEFSIPTGKVAAEIDSINERLSALAKERDALRQKPVGTPTAADHKRWRESEQEYNDLLDKRLKMVKEATANPFKQYQSLAGEAEARLTQNRMNLTPAERTARPPWLEFDVPREQQIVRGLLGEPTGPAMSVKAPSKLFRGVGPTTGKNTSTLGKGLYSSPDKSFAAQYGAVSEVPVTEAFPKNPLVISGSGRGDAQGLFADWALEKSRLPNMREFNKQWPDPAEFVKSLGYDGVWIGSEIVKY